MVDKSKFESVFSRVMCLLPQEKLQEIILHAPEAPFDSQDENALSQMIQQGFDNWKSFHDRFGEERKAIRALNSGLANWDDLAYFLETLGGAKRVSGLKRHNLGATTAAVSSEADVTVLRLGESQLVCADVGESFVFDLDGTPLPRAGMNRPEVAETLRRHAFPGQAAGIAFVKWPEEERNPFDTRDSLTGVLVLLKQTFRDNGAGTWTEIGLSLHCYVTGEESVRQVTGIELCALLRGLFRASYRKAAIERESLISKMVEVERNLFEQLRKPSDLDRKSLTRHTVVPLLAAIVST